MMTIVPTAPTPMNTARAYVRYRVAGRKEAARKTKPFSTEMYIIVLRFV